MPTSPDVMGKMKRYNKFSLMRLVFIFIILFVTGSSFAQTTDDDNDGIPNSEDLCPAEKGTKANKGCPGNTFDLSEADKKTFIKNFQTILQNIPTKFQKIKTGDEDVDFSQRISWYKSTLQLFPNHSNKENNRIMFGTYSGKPVIGFSESIRADVKILVDILMPALKARGVPVLKECIASFQKVKGSCFVKKFPPNEYYTTTLPSLGFNNKYVAESVSLDVLNESMVRKKFTYFTAKF
jgi:hypothetical protein